MRSRQPKEYKRIMRASGTLLVGMMLLYRVSTAFSQCDDTRPPPPPDFPIAFAVLSYSLNGQTVQAEPNGNFFIPNVPAPDFAPADFVGDDFLTLTAVKITKDQTLYAFSRIPFQINAGGRFVFESGANMQDLSAFTTTPPVLPESLALTTLGNPIITPVSQGGPPLPLQTLATFPGGSQMDVTLPAKWTTYRTSNASIARAVPDNSTTPTLMQIEGVSPGIAFITATNSGATSVVKITVANPANQISTTVEGFVRNAADLPVSGASITVKLSDGTPLDFGTTDATGFFSISSVTLLDTTPEIFAEATFTATGLTEFGSSVFVAPIANGITDVGIITIDIVCDTPWSAAFGPTTFEGFDIFDMAVFDDDGPGQNPPSLFVAGSFTSAGGTTANNIAKWDGRRWVPLVGSTGFNGVNAEVNGLAVVDLQDDNGPALYAVGRFVRFGGPNDSGPGVNKIARWDGTNWSALGAGVGSSEDNAFAVAGFDDGTGGGMELYVGGSFMKAGGVDQQNNCVTGSACVDALNIAKWNPNSTAWSAVGTGVSGSRVLDMAVFGDGSSSPKLYIGGDIFVAGSPNSANIATWDGVTISGVGYNGLPGAAGNKVTSLVVFDDGSGNGTALYAGGDFNNPRNFGNPDPIPVELQNMARWDGAVWSALGNSLDNDVLSLAGLDDGVNKILYASGQFSDVRFGGGGVNLSRVAQWNGNAWSSMGDGIESFGTAMTVFDDGNGEAVYVGGAFNDGGAGRATASSLASKQGYVAKWDDPDWSVLSNGLNSEVKALVVHDDGAGTALYAGGSFTPPKGPQDSNESRFASRAVAKFDGTTWLSLGSGIDCVGIQCVASVHALTVFDEDGTNPNPPRLFAGGDFATAGGSTANNVARWDGIGWSEVGTVGGGVEALAVFDDDGGGTNPSALYAGGVFFGGIKKWDGTAWVTFGSGVTGSVFAEAVFNGELYIGGNFVDAGGAGGPSNLAKWDGSTWSAVGSGVNGSVYALTVFDDGTGPALYVGGEFLLPVTGGVTANRVAKWDGTMWSAMDSGLGPNPGTARVDTLAAFDDGQGERLYAGGDFTTAGGVAVNRMAKWTGATWLPVGVSSQMGSDPGGGVDGAGTVAVQAMAAFDDGINGPALFAGGAFDMANGVPSSNIAKLGCR